jgi:DNA end-binding protein Ku
MRCRLPNRMVDQAVQLEKKSGPFDTTKLADHYGTALKELAQAKMKGHKIVAKEADRPSGGNVVDLMKALRWSVGEHPGAGRGKRREARGERNDTNHY